MHFSVVFLFVGFLVSSVICIPATLYRSTALAPKDAKAAGGIKSKGSKTSTAPDQKMLFDHVEGLLKSPSKDPFISTSDDIDVSKGDAATSSKYVYTIDSSKITEKIWDCKAEYARASRTYGHAKEREFSVEYTIPWAAITKVQTKDDTGTWRTLKMPTKRMLAFPDEDIFAE